MRFLLVLAVLVEGLRAPQTLVCLDAKSQQEITLVGCMHYNPASIALAAKCVAEAENLGAVVVESCEARWKKTTEVQPARSALKELLPSEMLAAADAAAARGAPLSLGDVDVGELFPRVRALAVETAGDLADFPKGWRRIGADISRGAALASGDGLDESLGLRDILDPRLLGGFLVSAVRYPAAAFLKAPVPVGVGFASLLAGGNALDGAAASAVGGGVADPLAYAAISGAVLAVNVVLPVVLLRLLLVAFLEERNVRLARSIREAAGRGSVVAILGALHVNGVARLLLSPEDVGPGAAGTWWDAGTDRPAE